MGKRIIILFIILVSTNAYAFVMKPIFSGSPCDDCGGPLRFSWHMEDNDSTPDVTIGRPCGCSDSDKIGAQTGSPTFSTSQKSDGAYSLFIDANGEYYTFDLIGDYIDDIKLTFDIYIVSYPASAQANILNISDNGGLPDYIDVSINSATDLIVFRGIDDGGSGEHGLTVDVPTGSWVSCEYQFKQGITGNDHYLKCGAVSQETDTDAAAADSVTKAYFGDIYGSQTASYYLDNVKITACDRY